jgi:hypothetical protein
LAVAWLSALALGLLVEALHALIPNDAVTAKMIDATRPQDRGMLDLTVSTPFAAPVIDWPMKPLSSSAVTHALPLARHWC